MSSSLFRSSIALLCLLSLLPLYTAFLVDVDGDPIRNGKDYYIISIASKGTLTYIHRNNKCPLFITQEYAAEISVESSVGTSVTISTPLRKLYINLGDHVDLAFTGSASETPCKESLAWKRSFNALARQAYITTGGGSVDRPFTITKRDRSLLPTYELKHCVVNDNEKTCTANVGLFEDNGLLGLTEHPTTFSFKKAFNVLELSTD